MLRLFVALCAVAMISAGEARAELKVNITQGHSDPMPVALPALNGQGAAESRIGEDVMRVVANDLESSGLFRPIDKSAFIEQLTFGQVLPRFADWRQISAQGLVTGGVADAGPGSVTISFRLWDVYGEEQIAGKEYTTKRDNWRRIAHLIADEVYSRLTGEGGYFDSRIVYVAESGPAKRRVKRLAIMDQDGANHKFLTDGSYLVLTPRFSPSYQEIIYLSYARGKPRVHIRNLETGQEDIVGEFKGMSFAPRFSHSGDRVIMSIAEDGNSDIYMMKLRDRKLVQLTNDPAIDTSPSYSPDEKKIVFNSDRGGSQQLYTMNADGSNVQRISFGDGRYGTPVWSPRGDTVAFTKMRKGTFYIGMMRSDGSGERLLAEGYLVEGPTWSPNGRVIIFARQDRGRGDGTAPIKLRSVDITGQNERELVTPLDASDPAWSGLLPL